MPIEITLTTVKNVLTRTSGYLREVCSHSLQPYRGCTFGNALCGVGCYVQHSRHITSGRPWGGFLEIRTNAALSYAENIDRERRWAAKRGVPFSIFLSSATDPFVPQESRHGVTRSVLEAMCRLPPDELIVQTHSHRVADCVPILRQLAERCRLRVHVSIETDREQIEGLPPHASSIEKRFEACSQLRAAGLAVVVTVSPLLPIADPPRFFSRIAQVAEAVVIDHFIEGDGTRDGSRTWRTPLPAAMASIDRASVELAYRERIVHCAREFLPGRVGISIAGFAGRYG